MRIIYLAGNYFFSNILSVSHFANLDHLQQNNSEFASNFQFLCGLVHFFEIGPRVLVMEGVGRLRMSAPRIFIRFRRSSFFVVAFCNARALSHTSICSEISNFKFGFRLE